MISIVNNNIKIFLLILPLLFYNYLYCDKINIKNYLLGKFDPALNTNFVKVEKKYSLYPSIYLHKDVYKAFVRMYEDARQDNIKLYIISGFRSFDYQKEIWEKKWNSRKFFIEKGADYNNLTRIKKSLIILKYSSMPGTSRHHWGTEIDINSLNNSYFSTTEGKKVYEWLIKNAGKYGFARPYTEKNKERINGYEEEKWHWSYTNISKKLIHLYTNYISYSDIKGFEGDDTVKKIDVIKNYVLGVDKSCK